MQCGNCGRPVGGQGGFHGTCHGRRGAGSSGGLVGGRHGRWRPGTSQGETADAEAECQQSWTEQVDLNGDVTRTEPSGNLSLSVPSSVLPLHGAVGPASVRVP